MTERVPVYPGQWLPDGSGEWATVPPGSELGRQMLRVLNERAAQEKAMREAKGFDR